jgi:hypothetical protein
MRLPKWPLGTLLQSSVLSPESHREHHRRSRRALWGTGLLYVANIQQPLHFCDTFQCRYR